MDLVTGGTGIVGAHILAKLTSRGDKLLAIKRKSSDLNFTKNVFEHYKNPHFDNITWLEGDITDLAFLESVFERKIFNLYHAAAVVDFDKKIKSSLLQTNIDGTKNLVNLSIENGINKIGFISSVATLSKDGNGNNISEANLFNPKAKNSIYAISKFEAEREVWRANQEGLSTVIINPGIIIGPGELHKSSTAIFGKIKKGLKYYTKGINGFVDARDVAESIICLVESEVENERYICVGENLSFEKFLSMAAKSIGKESPGKYASPFLTELAWRSAAIISLITGKKQLITKAAARASHNVKLYQNEKLKKALNYEFTSIEEACSNTSNFLRKQFF